MNEYQQRRAAVYQPLAEEGVFTWAEMYGQEYALPHCLPVSTANCAELRHASEQLGRVFDKAVQIVRRAPDELLLEIGVPRAAIGAVRMTAAWPHATLIGRFDFALTPDGFKMLEFNADTPSGVVEAFHVNGAVCRHWQRRDPNEGMDAQLNAAFECWRRCEGIADDAVAVFSALDWHAEDAGTTRYLLRQSGWRGRFVGLADLRVNERGVFIQTADGVRAVDVLFRMHPLELLSQDQASDGTPVGALLLRLAQQGRIRLVNPPAALLAQTKALQALIWGAAEAGEGYTPQECATIRRYMLPTYLDNRFRGRMAYAVKPILGREGKSVRLFDKAGCCTDGGAAAEYDGQLVVYQQRVELESHTTETANGMFCGKLLWGAFLLGTEAAALVVRLGGAITGDMAYYLPICLQE